MIIFQVNLLSKPLTADPVISTLFSQYATGEALEACMDSAVAQALEIAPWSEWERQEDEDGFELDAWRYTSATHCYQVEIIDLVVREA